VERGEQVVREGGEEDLLDEVAGHASSPPVAHLDGGAGVEGDGALQGELLGHRTGSPVAAAGDGSVVSYRRYL
jgi:hypothetical protein